MILQRPTLEQWKELYIAASEFKESECWRWMRDNDNFGVVDPATGEVAYCSILGRVVNLVGIAAYLGQEGLINLTELVLAQYDEDIKYEQNCLALTYEDRDQLEKEDREIIKALGLKFRGRGEWPLFREFSPGMFPWFLDAKSCSFFTHVIWQALDVAYRCRDSKDILTDYPASPKILVREPVETSSGLEWKDSYREVQAAKGYVTLALKDELLARRLKNYQQSVMVWEVDTFYFPVPLVDNRGDRPYFAQGLLVVDSEDGFILGYETFQDLESEGNLCLQKLIDLIQEAGCKPAEILVRKKKTYHLFKDFCRQVGIHLQQVPELKSFEEVKSYFLEGIE